MAVTCLLPVGDRISTFVVMKMLKVQEKGGRFNFWVKNESGALGAVSIFRRHEHP